MSQQYEQEEQEDDEDENETDRVEWMNIVFLPFHPVFRLIVLCAVVVNTLLTPIDTVSPFECSDFMDSDAILWLLKSAYNLSGGIYAIDILLHIAHRVADISKRREFLPKSKFWITLDIISLIPLYLLFSSDPCPPLQIWPNVLKLIHFINVYRIEEYYSLRTTHNLCKILIGFTLLIFVGTICATALCVLIITQRESHNSTLHLYDWRKYFFLENNITNPDLERFLSTGDLVMTYVNRLVFANTTPRNIVEYYLTPCVMMASFVVYGLAALLKSFTEAILKLQRTFEFFPHVQKIIKDTQIKNPSAAAHIDVTNFYSFIWKKHDGITTIPAIITEFPRHLRLVIKQDLTWPVFYHSPTLRRVSQPFKSWLCDLTHLDFKLPNEDFFANPRCLSHLFYLKSGIVQLISTEDGTTPLLSMTGGTIFGDINFFLPPMAPKKITIRCLTYCEVYYFTRSDILKAMHLFPEDRKNILERVRNKIKHARILYTCKMAVRGLDRTEDEGITWIKKRWWELSETISTWKKTSTKMGLQWVLPPEESVYHCSKYIGQVVLCPNKQMQRKSMFANSEFPWILVPDSSFGVVWDWIVRCTVILVLVLYPLFLPLSDKSGYFLFFKYWTNVIYMADICISLLTAVEVQSRLESHFASVMFMRCKSSTFILNVLATIWIENFVVFIGKPELYTICQFNRLIKVYVVFLKDNKIQNIKGDPGTILYQSTLIKFSFSYVTGFFVYELAKISTKLRLQFFFSGICKNNQPCDPTAYEMLNVVFAWVYLNVYDEPWPYSHEEIVVGIVLDYVNSLVVAYCAGILMAVIYLRNVTTADYVYFAIRLKGYYEKNYTHPELWKRLKIYFKCYWKYNRVLDMSDGSLLRREPYDIYWKAHGEVAAKIISNSMTNANPALIKELAYNATFKILPKYSTILLPGAPVKDVYWLLKGIIVRKHVTSKGVFEEEICGPYDKLITFTVFFGKPSLATCMTVTECEMLRISTQEFFRVMSRYPLERLLLRTCVNNFKASFNDLVKMHRLPTNTSEWNEIGRASETSIGKLEQKAHVTSKSNWRHPRSDFAKYWMKLRAVFVAISIITASFEGGCGAAYRRIMVYINLFFNSMIFCDIILKCCIAYYDKRGILIFDKLKCMAQYFSRGLILDIIAIIPWEQVLPRIYSVNMDTALLIKALTKYARINLLLGYFDFLADVPLTHTGIILIIKWKIFMVLLHITTSHYLIWKCVKFTWSDTLDLINVSKRGECWMPTFINIDKVPPLEQLKLIYIESLDLAQSAFLGNSCGIFNIPQSDLVFRIILFPLTIIYWCIFCYSLTMLALSTRVSTLYRHAFASLANFLKAERLDKKLIGQSLAHFSYFWKRTGSIKLYDSLVIKHTSSMFMQDFYYYFYKTTFAGVNSILYAGEQVMKNLSCLGIQLYLLPNVPIMREMDLNPWVYIVHKGTVAITQEDKTLAVLTKGSIFGQLKGTQHRPVKVSAHTLEYTDIIRIPVYDFQQSIDDQVPATVESNVYFMTSVGVRLNIYLNVESDLDYIPVKITLKENPYTTIRYMLRAGKILQMPWMMTPIKAHASTRYSCWLGLVWVIIPFISTAIVLLLNTLTLEVIHQLMIVLVLFDLVHLAHFISEFYTMEMMVINDECELRHVKLRKLKEWQTYVDILSLILPLLTVFTSNWGYQLARILRLRFFYDFYLLFCQDFKNQLIRFLIDLAIFTLILHAMVCGWVVIACRPSVLVNSYYIPKYEPAEGEYNKYYNEWMDPVLRGEGCKTFTFVTDSNRTSKNLIFLVPIRWQDDYAIALGFVISIFTRLNSSSYPAVTFEELWYKCTICCVLDLICIWVSSLAIRAVYLKYRELLKFDYNVTNLFCYLERSGLTKALLACVRQYTILLWQKQRGNWMPELVLGAPLCLREDLYVALYSYHLEDIPLFKKQPDYFTRQLVTRLHRVVVFPGRAIVAEGDIFACMYFIHDGEVEKWYTDSSGEKKMVSLLTTNGFFGVIPGLFPDTPIQCTFISRTVVDMVFLKHKDWQDLLQGYPEIRRDLYAAAKQLKKDLEKK